MERSDIPMDDIHFYVVSTPEEYELLGAFQERIEGKKDTLGFPTVYGLDAEGNLRGFTSTSTEFGAVISGPTVIDPNHKPRLEYGKAQIGAHETALRNLGVTQYLFSVEKSNQRMFQAVSAGGLTPYAQDENLYWYKRDLV